MSLTLLERYYTNEDIERLLVDNNIDDDDEDYDGDEDDEDDEDDDDMNTISSDLTFNSFSTESINTEEISQKYCNIIINNLKMTKKENKKQNTLINRDKHHNEYVIGLVELSHDNSRILLSSAILPCIFFKNKHNNIINYLKNITISNNVIKTIHIMQIYIVKENEFEFQTVILKTYWIKIIQIKWKKWYKNKYKQKASNIISLYNLIRHMPICKKECWCNLFIK